MPSQKFVSTEVMVCAVQSKVVDQKPLVREISPKQTEGKNVFILVSGGAILRSHLSA